jgi:hypothetical protein
VARDLCKAVLCLKSVSALFTYAAPFPQIDLPGDMVDESDKDEALEEN